MPIVTKLPQRKKFLLGFFPEYVYQLPVTSIARKRALGSKS